MDKPKLVTFLPMPIEYQLSHMFSNRIDPSKVDVVHIPMNTSDDEACKALSDATVIMCPPIRPINRKLLEASKGVQLFQVVSVGYDFIDLEAANEFKIPVANTPGYSTTSVAEHTLMFTLVLLKKGLHLHKIGNKKQRKDSEVLGFWDQVWELRDKTLGILGLGSIGKEVARLAKVFGPEIIYYKRNRLSEEEEEKLGISYCSFDELLSKSDIFSIHVPLTDDTKGMIGREEVAKMKSGAILLNLSRGEVIDEQAVADAVINGKLSGVGVDVLIERRVGDIIDTPSPLIGLENVMITPHMAGPTLEARRRCLKLAIDNVLRVLGGEKAHHLVSDI